MTAILRRVHLFLCTCGLLYGLILLLLLTPFVQIHVFFLHKVKFPLFARFDEPEKYGLAPGKTVNLKLVTSDNVALGAWFVLSDTFYQSIPFLSHITTNTSTAEDITSARIRASLAVHPTIIFFHGNAATRGVPARVRHYAAFSSRLRANVLAIDYRGFADSEGYPTEAGLALDARAAWEWVLDHGANPRNVLLVGHSLGSAVAAKLAQQLSADGVELKGLVLLSPFSSITVLLDTYHVLGFLPIAMPLAMFPGADRFIAWSVVYDFNTRALIQSIDAPILIAHAENDRQIPLSHSVSLFEALLDHSLPVSETHIQNFGTLRNFVRSSGGKVAVLLTGTGGHNLVGTLEGVQDVMREIFGF